MGNEIDPNGKHEEKEFEIACSWSVETTITVKAKSLEEAINIAYDTTTLPDGLYVEGSFQVSREFTKELNEDVIGASG